MTGSRSIRWLTSGWVKFSRKQRSKAEFFGHQHVPHVGLYFSVKTRDWFGRENPTGYFRSFMGAHQMLVESHFPVEFLFDETVTLETLQRYPVVFLANTAILSPAEIDLIRRYVEQGVCLGRHLRNRPVRLERA